MAFSFNNVIVSGCVIVALVIFALAREAASKDYCVGDDLKIQCGIHEIILMEKAQFGRMRNGECIEGDLGYLGCFFDALGKLDESCSGKQSCHLPRLAKQDFRDIMDQGEHQCYRDLELYLEAHHNCVQVLDTDHLCRHGASKNTVHLSTSGSYLNSDIIKSKPCLLDRISGTITLYVETLQGQQINVSLVDFGGDSWHNCIKYGKIIELGTMQHTSICGGQQRQKHLMVSNSNKIEIQLENHLANNFLLRFEALGCADIPAPSGGWKKREGSTLTISCYTSKQTWTLTCQDNRWLGVIGNCSADVNDTPKTAMSLSETQTSIQITSEVWLALVIACSVIVLVLAVTFGIVCWRRRTLQIEIDKMKANGRVLKVNKSKDPQESEYMFPNFRPRSTTSQTEDAVYDFCFSPGSIQGTLPNNMTSSVTLPCRNSANIQYNNMVPYPAPPESPKYKTLVVVRP